MYLHGHALNNDVLTAGSIAGTEEAVAAARVEHERARTRQLEAARCLADRVTDAVKVGMPEEVVELVLNPIVAILKCTDNFRSVVKYQSI